MVRTDITPTGMGQKELYNWMKRVEGGLSGTLGDGVLGGDPQCAEGSTTSTSVRMAGRIHYRIDGKLYSVKDVEAVLAGTGQDITQAKYGAWRLMIDATGTLTTVAATSTGAMAFTAAEDALMNLTTQAPTTDAIDVGYLVIVAAAGGFTIGTDDPKTADAQVTTATYYDVVAPRGDNGLTAAPSVPLAIGTTDTQYSHGTINAKTNGKNVAQIAAGTTVAFDDAKTITTAIQWGGHLIITDLAGTGLYTLPADGLADGTVAMTYTSRALADVALDTREARLPLLFTVVGRIVVDSKKATFTYATDDIGGTDGMGYYITKDVVIPRLSLADLS